MKNKLLLILIISTNIINAQNTIGEYILEVFDSEHIDCVKSIFIKNISFSHSENEIHTFKRGQKVVYDESGNIIKRFDYQNSLEKPSQVINFDSLSRILTIERENETIHQYFGNNLKYPDSIIVYSKDSLKKEQTINHFSDSLVVKQELFTNDTLRNYTIFEYDTKKQLIKKRNIKTENGYGIKHYPNFTKTVTTKDFSPNDSTFYFYEHKLDTLIVTEYRNNKLKKVKKSYKNGNLETEIHQDYWEGRLSALLTIFKGENTEKREARGYNDKNELDYHYETTSTDNKIVSNLIKSMSDRLENSEITYIKTTYDDHGNWILKSFIRNESRDSEIQREIEYYCH